VAVAVAFVDDEGAVELLGLGADDELAGLRTEPHRAALFGNFLLRVEKADDRVWRVFVELGRVRFFELEHVARKFDAGDLHSQTKAEVRQALFPAVARGLDFPLDAAFAETAR